MSEAQFVLISGALLAAGVLASWLAARVRVPALVLLLVVGMVVGSDVLLVGERWRRASERLP